VDTANKILYILPLLLFSGMNDGHELRCSRIQQQYSSTLLCFGALLGVWEYGRAKGMSCNIVDESLKQVTHALVCATLLDVVQTSVKEPAASVTRSASSSVNMDRYKVIGRPSR